MSETPTSNLFPSRVSTPVNELDDHRFQPESLPRADSNRRSSGRRGTATSFAPEQRPPILQVNGEAHEGTIARDFENAILDDEVVSPPDGLGSRRRSVARRESASPGIGGRENFRRPRKYEHQRPNSRDSSSTRTSISPPNSVEAFAEPRRRARAETAGTNNSNAPGHLYNLTRSPSQNTFKRVRAHSHDETNHGENEIASLQDSVEDDVCFPSAEEIRKPYTIDFDELQDFVLRDLSNTPIQQVLHPQQSFTRRSIRDRRQSTSKNYSVQFGSMDDDSMALEKSIEAQKISSVDESEDEKGDLKPSAEHSEPLKRWSFFSSELQESIHAPNLGALLMPGETFQHLFELRPEGGCWWLDILMPSEEEVEVICKAFGIHGLTREDIIQQETRQKVELFKSYYFVCFQSFFQMDQHSKNYLDPVNVYAVVLREGILTFTFSPSPHAGNVRKRLGGLRDYVVLGSDWICYALIDDIVDSFDPAIRSMERETDSIEDMVFIARPEDSRQVLRQIGECRKKVMSLLRLLGGKADVIKSFAKRCNEHYDVTPRQDVGLYLSDIQDHVVTMTSNLGHFDHVLSRSHANYLAQLSVDNIAQGNRANQVLAKVTFLASILVPLNLVCGLFGMNVDVPGRSSEGLSWFFGILGCMVLFVLVIFVFARKRRFI